MKRILLVNAESVQTVCLARSFRRLGHYVIGFCTHRCSSGYATRWLNERYKTPDIIHDETSFSQYLYNYLDHHSVDAIIPLTDEGAEFLSRNKESLENKGVICAVPPFDIFSRAHDKQKLMELCDYYNFSHPKTCPIDINNIKKAADYVGFPAMIKPNVSQGAKGIVRVESFDEFQEKFPYIEKQFGGCTLQEYIDQPGYYYNVMIYRDKKGTIVGQTVIKIRRYFPLKGGSSCYCETTTNPALVKECGDLLEKINWHGFADFDILENKNTGDLKIIEINPRVPSSLQASFASGVDFGAIYIADLFDGVMPIFKYVTGKQVRWMGLDVLWFIFSSERFMFKPSWFKFFGKDVSYHDGSWDDPLPMAAGMLAGVVKYLNPEFRKLKLS